MRKRAPLTIRSFLLLMAGAAALYVSAIVAYAVIELRPTASALRTNASVLALQFDSLRARTRALETAVEQVRRLAGTGIRDSLELSRADSLRTFITHAAEQSVDVRASMLLSDIPIEMRVALADAASYESNLAATLLEALQDARAGDTRAARSWMTNADSVQERLAASLSDAQRLGLLDVATHEHDLSDRAWRILIALSGWLVLGLLFGTLAFGLMYVRLFKPLKKLSQGLNRVAHGDLDVSLPVARQDELGQLEAHFNEMTEVLRARPEMEALRKSEQNFSEIFESTPVAIALSNLATGRFINVNQAFERLFGFSRAELIGKSSIEIGLWPDSAQRAVLASRLTEAGEVNNFEISLLTKDGSIVELNTYAHVIQIQGQTALLSNFIDVTASKASQRALQKSQETFARLFQFAPSGISLSTLEDGRYIDVNDEYQRICGYTREEMVGKTSLELNIITPETRATLVEAISRHRVVTDHAVPIRTKSGEMRTIRGAFQQAELEGRTVLLSTFTDVTERMQAQRQLEESEARFRTAFMTGSDAYVIVERDTGKILAANGEFELLYGYETSEIIGHTSLELGVWADPEARLEVVKQVNAEGALRNWPVLGRRRNGETFPVLYSVRALPNTEPVLWLGVIHDMTLQRKAEEDLRKMEAQFRQAQRLEAIGRLAGGVAHDFNNVLTAISGFSELLLEKFPPGDERAEDVIEIRRATEQATALTRQLLAFSRKQILQPRVLDLGAVVASLQKMLPRLLGADVQVNVMLPHELGAVRADPGQLEQVIVNLAVNARDAMPKGGRLTIKTANVHVDPELARAHAGAHEGNYVMLSMTDTGTGMDAETQAHIFEPFFTTKERGKGTGLGLSTVHGIVSQSGGFLLVFSELGRGTTFKIYLPRVEESVDEAAVTQPVEEVPGGSESILIAEDDPAIRHIMAHVLTQKGYRTWPAADGESALNLAHERCGAVDLLVTDMVMPGMSGRTLAEQLRREQSGIRVLIVSGYSDDEIAADSTLPNTMYLQKPFTPRTLAQKVREALDLQPR